MKKERDPKVSLASKLEATHREVTWFPEIDWNVKLFGAHGQKVPAGWHMPPESHPGFEIMIIREGIQETRMEHNRYVLHPDDVLLIPPGFKHENRCASPGGMFYFTAHFNVDDPGFREEMILNGRLHYPAGSEDNLLLRPILEEWIGLLRDPSDSASPAARFRIQAKLFELLAVLSGMAGGGKTKEAERNPPASVRYARAIAETIKLRFQSSVLQEEEELPLRISEIAASYGVTPGYVLEVFRKVFGVAPRQYLSQLKLNEAKGLIQQAELSLQEIAYRLGYAHLSHFSRQFKRWTGMSPLQYRQSKQQQRT